MCRRVFAGATDQKQTPTAPNPTTAKDAVEAGLEVFSQGSTDRALELFQLGLSLGPDEDEACAALYNSACCYVKQKRWQEATDAVVRAVNDYNLKLEVAIQVGSAGPSGTTACLNKGGLGSMLQGRH